MSRVFVSIIMGALFVSVAFAQEHTPIGDLKRGMSASIQGEVTRILDEDEFRLQDETGSIRVYSGWKNRVFVRTGEKLTVRGFVDNDIESYFRPEFYAFEIVREDGSVIKLHQE
jgi:uncharacterized protein YdeI (BOF family)